MSSSSLALTWIHSVLYHLIMALAISDLLIDSTDYLYFFNDQYDWAEDHAVELMQARMDLHQGNCGWLDMIENN